MVCCNDAALNIMDEGDVKLQPYKAHLAQMVRLMRSDLDRLMRPGLGKEISNSLDCSERDFMSLYGEWLAPENMFSRQG